MVSGINVQALTGFAGRISLHDIGKQEISPYDLNRTKAAEGPKGKRAMMKVEPAARVAPQPAKKEEEQVLLCYFSSVLKAKRKNISSSA